MHVAWVDWSAKKPLLEVDSFDPITAAQTAHREYAVIPVDATDEGIDGIAGTEGPEFAAVYTWISSTNVMSPVTVLVGSLDDASFRQDVFITSENSNIHTSSGVGWDGQAFAIHAYNPLSVARLSKAGQLLLPFTQYGDTADVGYGELGHKTMTEPVSGRTWVFDAWDPSYLNGHDLSGKTLVGLPKSIANDPQGDNYPILGVDPKGAWLGFRRQSTHLQRVDLDGHEVGPIVEAPIPGTFRHGVFALPDGHAVALVDTGDAFVAIEYDGSSFLSPATLMTSPDPTGQVPLDLRMLQGVAWNDERWVAFQNETAGYEAARVVTWKAGCTYAP